MLTRPEPMPLPLARGHPDPGDRPARRQPLRPCSASGARADGPRTWSPPAQDWRASSARTQVSCVPIGAVERIRGDELAAAVAAAARVDAIVLMLGEARYMSGEAAARLYPEIPLAQYRLVEALQSVGKPLIAIQTAGRALPVSRLAGQPPGDVRQRRRGLLHLAARDRGRQRHRRRAERRPCALGTPHRSRCPARAGSSPRLSASGASAGPSVDDLPRMMRDFRDKIGNSGKWVSHLQETFERDDCPIAFPFGHGLTYTDFAYSSLRLSATELSAGDPNAYLEARVTITNRGRHPGVAVPQLYLRDTVAVPAPRRLELRGFERIELLPGESARSSPSRSRLPISRSTRSIPRPAISISREAEGRNPTSIRSWPSSREAPTSRTRRPRARSCWSSDPGRARRKAWWARQDSNLRQHRYERRVLTTELRAR